ncbi:MAG: c-type cytochrome [Candidatus Limnocylindrales bacterium]
MSFDRTGRELEPRRPDDELGPRTPEGQLTPREGPDGTVERFYAGEGAHTVGLTEERTAQIVRQSGSARMVAFLVTLVIVLFIPLYWFYDLGVPALAGTSRLEKEKQAQLVTDVARGEELYLANCAQCHGAQGQGGVGPALNDQAKLANAVTPAGLPGTGHLNPDYIEEVLTVGGRIVCGDPNSIMPVWADTNGGPLNYREIEELIAFLTASNETTWTSEAGGHGGGGEGDEAADETAAGPTEQRGWRDPNYQPEPGATEPPACWRDPDGIQIGANASEGAGGSAAPIESPGTAEQPRVVHVVETAQLTIADEGGQKLDAIPAAAGETVRFEVENAANFTHNFYIGPADQLAANAVGELEGVPDFETGVETFDYTVPEEGDLQFACTVPGHYASMNGVLQIQPAAQ